MASTKWSAAELPDMSERTVVVTGASSGLGAVIARDLAGAGARVVMAVRDVAKGKAVAATIVGRTEVRRLDVSDLASVRAFAEGWSGRLDILINNAGIGIMAVPQSRTVDGFHIVMGTNYLGPFALTNLLLPHITDRVVSISSGLAGIGRIDLDDLNWQNRSHMPWRVYGQSKLALLLFTTELQRRLTEVGSGVRALAAHPGLAATPLDQHMGASQVRIVRFGYRFFAQKKVEYGALPALYAATQDLPGNTYVGPGGRSGEIPKIEKRSKASNDSQVARQLWDRSSRLTHTGQGLESDGTGRK
jgi:NAD(P)-dependent dehydrogenase (short-subunit alcohol dehydrogenase family)